MKFSSGVLFATCCLTCLLSACAHQPRLTKECTVTRQVKLQDVIGSFDTRASQVNFPTGDYDQPPQFPGGTTGVTQYLACHVRYPKAALKVGLVGQVMVRFTVTKKGKVKDVHVLKSLSPECDAEIVRVVKRLPRFTPARRNGQPVNVQFTVPFTFRLE